MISILTPFRNAEPYFTVCLDSILAQTYTDWELLLINDFSTDNSLAVANEYAKKDNRIKVLGNTNAGLIHALRLGYAAINGRFITRMDADDIMPVSKLSNLRVQLLNAGTGNVAIGLVKYFSADGLKAGYQYYEKWLNELTSSEQSYSQIYKECVIPSPNFLIHKEDFEMIGGFTPDVYPEDYDLAFRMYANGIKVTSCKEITHLWRDHQARSTRTQEHYNPLNFIPLKVKHFVEIDYDSNKTLVIWGAAKKGKLIARELIKKQIPFDWVCENVQRFGHNVYDVIIKDAKQEQNYKSKQVIIAVSNREEQKLILKYLEECHSEKGSGAFLFF